MAAVFPVVGVCLLLWAVTKGVFLIFLILATIAAGVIVAGVLVPRRELYLSEQEIRSVSKGRGLVAIKLEQVEAIVAVPLFKADAVIEIRGHGLVIPEVSPSESRSLLLELRRLLDEGGRGGVIEAAARRMMQ